MKTCDLHSHSYYSDGSLSPKELVALAKRQGLSALALTDHNTAKGLAEFMEAGRQADFETIAGCEFSTEFEGREYHILGLFMPESSWAEIEDYVLLQHMAKRNSNKKLIEKLNDAGFHISYEEVAAITDADEFNRAHVARVLLKKNYVKSVQHAFETLLDQENGYYTPPKRLGSVGTIHFIRQYGGAAVWAHPFHRTDEATVERVLPVFAEQGLDAIETVYTTFTAHETERAKELAAQYGLLESGGSDFHGAAKPNISLGSGYGELVVPYAFCEKLKES